MNLNMNWTEPHNEEVNKTHEQLEINRANAVDVSVMRDVRQK